MLLVLVLIRMLMLTADGSHYACVDRHDASDTHTLPPVCLLPECGEYFIGLTLYWYRLRYIYGFRVPYAFYVHYLVAFEQSILRYARPSHLTKYIN